MGNARKIFLSTVAAAAAFFLTYSLVYELLIIQPDFNLVMVISSDQPFTLYSSVNRISDELGGSFIKHEIPKADQHKVLIPFPDNDYIRGLYFTTAPRLLSFKIDSFYLDHPVVSYGMAGERLKNCLSPSGYAYDNVENYVIEDGNALRANFDKEMAVLAMGKEFFEPMYWLFERIRLIWASTAAILVFIMTIIYVPKLTALHKIPGYQLVFTLLFLLSLYIPFVSQKEIYSGENRKLADFPELNQLIWRIPAKYNDYYNDHFPFRNFLGQLNNYMQIGLFNNSPMPNHVRIGKDGWLFNYIPDVRPYVADDKLYTLEELHTIQQSLEQKRDWLALKGADFYFMLTPFKHELYPEKLPEIMRRGRKRTKRDQLMQYLRDSTDLQIIDPFDPLSKMNDSIDVFFKNDIHWNQLGSFLGYRIMMKELRKKYPELHPLNFSDFNIHSKMTMEGDLMHLMNLRNFFPSPTYTLNPKFERHAIEYRNQPFVDQELSYIYFENDHGMDKKFLMVRDSYASFMLPHISEHFKQSSFSWNTTILPERVERDKPDIVVLEMMEMYAIWLTVDNQPQIIEDLKAAGKTYP